MTLVADAGVLTARLDVLPEGLRPAGRAAGLTGRVVIQARERTDRACVIRTGSLLAIASDLTGGNRASGRTNDGDRTDQRRERSMPLPIRSQILRGGRLPAGTLRRQTYAPGVIPHRDHHDRHHGDDRPHAEQFHHSADREKTRRSGPSRFH